MKQVDIYCKVCGMVQQCLEDLGRPGIVLEIGCAEGNGVCRYAGQAKKVIAIDAMVSGRPDLFGVPPGRTRVDESKLREFRRQTGKFENVELVIGCSSWPATIDCVRAVLGDEQVDVLVIDGCHHPFDAVWNDFVLYRDMVSSDGFVIFDDVYEACILQAAEKAIASGQFELHERWKWTENLQEIMALRRI